MTELIKQLYSTMLRIRMIEEAIATEYANQEMRCPVHLCIGHEAIHAGVISQLKKTDAVFSNHRSHGHYIAKGGNIRAMIAEIYGKATGCSKGRGGSQHLIDRSVGFLGATPIVGGTIPVATGAALAAKMREGVGGVEGKEGLERSVTAVFFGDAATEEGVFHESLNFAALKKLPILYVCENNLYSIYTHIRDRQPDRPIYGLAKAHGIYAQQADGNDVETVYTTAKKAIEYIREGNGPAFLEFMTYRHREHCGPNFEPPHGRPEEEKESWRKKDPVERLEKNIGETEIRKMKETVQKEIDDAFTFAKKSPYPDEGVAREYVYSS